MVARAMGALTGMGLDPRRPPTLFGVTVVLSNLVSNVPATMLLLPAAVHPKAGAILALSSTLAGNLIIVGSIANIIVVDQAERVGVGSPGRPTRGSAYPSRWRRSPSPPPGSRCCNW